MREGERGEEEGDKKRREGRDEERGRGGERRGEGRGKGEGRNEGRNEGRRLIGEGKWMREEEKEEINDFTICRYWKERNTPRLVGST